MKTVIATGLGFHDGVLVQPETVFKVPDHLQGKWFEPFRGQAPRKKPVEAVGPTTLSELGKGIRQGPAFVKAPTTEGLAPNTAIAKAEPAAEPAAEGSGRASDQSVI